VDRDADHDHYKKFYTILLGSSPTFRKNFKYACAAIYPVHSETNKQKT